MVSVIFTVVFIIFMGISIWCGIKKDLCHALTAAASCVVSAAAAFSLSRLISSALGNITADAVIYILGKTFSSQQGSELFNSPEFYQIMKIFGHTLSVSALFVMLYIIIYILLRVLYHIIYKKCRDKKNADALLSASDAVSQKPWTLIASVLIYITAGFFSFVLAGSPVSALCRALDPDRISSDCYTKTELSQTVDKLNSNAILGLCADMGGVDFFNLLTRQKTGYGTVTPAKELTYIASFSCDTLDIIKYNNITLDDAETVINDVDDAIRNSALLAPLVSAAAPIAADAWKNGDSFFGLNLNIPKGRLGYLTNDILDIVSGWDETDIRNDFATVTELAALINEKKLFANANPDGLLNIFADEDYTNRLFTVLYGNDDFIELLPAAVYTGTALALDNIGIHLPAEYDFLPSTRVTLEQAQNEARIVAGLASTTASILKENGTLDISAMSVSQIKRLCSAVYEFKDSYFLEDMVSVIILQIIQSQTIYRGNSPEPGIVLSDGDKNLKFLIRKYINIACKNKHIYA